MTPFDGIAPPSKKKDALTPPPEGEEKPMGKLETHTRRQQHRKKEMTVWVIAISITLLLFVGWLALYLGGALTDEGGSSFWGHLTEQVDNLWDSIKTDILRLQPASEPADTVIQEEEIKQLEDHVFPQFNEPANQ